jgi:hypothetical protein
MNVNRASDDKDNYQDFNVQEFSAELDTVVKGSVFRPIKNAEACNREPLKDNAERYQEIL